jgi:hypothetical protein
MLSPVIMDISQLSFPTTITGRSSRQKFGLTQCSSAQTIVANYIERCLDEAFSCVVLHFSKDFCIAYFNNNKICLDALHGTWFIANDSQIWIRFYSSPHSLGMSSFRLFYSETIQCKISRKLFIPLFFFYRVNSFTRTLCTNFR